MVDWPSSLVRTFIGSGESTARRRFSVQVGSRRHWSRGVPLCLRTGLLGTWGRRPSIQYQSYARQWENITENLFSRQSRTHKLGNCNNQTGPQKRINLALGGSRASPVGRFDDGVLVASSRSSGRAVRASANWVTAMLVLIKASVFRLVGADGSAR